MSEQNKNSSTKGKKILYGIGIFVVLVILGAIFGDSKEEKEKEYISKLLDEGKVDSSITLLRGVIYGTENYEWAHSTIDSIESVRDSIQAVKDSTDAANLTAALKREIKSIQEGTDYSNAYQSKETLSGVVVVFGARAKLINEALESDNDEDVDLARKLEKLNRSEQMKEFPKVRKLFYEFIKKDLWKEDIKVKILGKRNTTIDFTGSVFARNKSKDEVQTSLSDVFKMYRFKRTQYSWSDIAREYTYYEITSPDDGELVEFD